MKKDYHFITDAQIREAVMNDYQKRKEIIGNDSLFALQTEVVNEQQKEALEFLLAYMPIGDITDYGVDFFAAQVKNTLEMRDKVRWKDSVPEYIFRHYVLPVRTNNETLDEFRTTYSEEIYNRVKEMSLKDAALEVNHWCHENVIYTSTDGRTFSPMAALKNAAGRCGEESVFAVAAFRSVGIPARQVYCPRWAHTDDNHAWVEVFVDGKWQFLGACEPEPVLNLGWFNAPASRGLLMLTNVFGNHYQGEEEVISQTPNYTQINVIYTYGPVAKCDITVEDENGNALEDALVEFKIFNYGEYNTVASKKTLKDGTCFLNAGLGDMFVWVSKGEKFGFSKISFGKDEKITIKVDKKAGDNISVSLDLVPPVEDPKMPEVSSEMREINSKRIAQEDTIRTRYTSTFFNEESAIVKAENINKDYSKKIADILVKSRGNSSSIIDFLSGVSNDDFENALSLLENVSTKDLRDVAANVFADHLKNSSNKENEYFANYILNPRIDREFLTPYKSDLLGKTDKEFAENVKNNPQVLVEWIKKNIKIDDSQNSQRLAIQPLGVLKARIADLSSCNRFFIAYCRSLGIAARYEPITDNVQYFFDNKWNTVYFGNAENHQSDGMGELIIKYSPTKAIKDPAYYSHFTIAKIENGALKTLSFESNSNVDMGAGVTVSNMMKKPLMLTAGNYILMTGSRQGDGSILSQIESFTIENGKKCEVEMIMRESAEPLNVIGMINISNLSYQPLTSCAMQPVSSLTKNKAAIIAILGAKQEPTNHALRDIAEFSNDFNSWGGAQVMLFADEDDYKKFDSNEFKGLPSTITYGIDAGGDVIDALIKGAGLTQKSLLPIVVLVNENNEVVFVSQGYTIGLGAQMLKVIHKL